MYGDLPEKWGLRARPFKVKVVESDTHASGTYDFLLVIHGNYGPIVYRFRDKGRFRLPSEFSKAFGLKNLALRLYRTVDGDVSYNRFSTIPALDGQTDEQRYR